VYENGYGKGRMDISVVALCAGGGVDMVGEVVLEGK
jgi:hypothetical protein